jgi:hypothetical protein
MADLKIINPTIQRTPARARGPLSSEEYNDFQDRVYSDILNISESLNSLYNTYFRIVRSFETDNISTKRRLDALENSLLYKEFVNGKMQIKVDRYIDFHDASNVIYPDNLSADKRAELKSQFGEIYLPANGIENKFFNFSLRNNQVVPPADLTVEVTSQFDKVDGNGIQDFEYGGDVDAGTPTNAFNGINESQWLRSITFPLESNVEQVEVQLTAIVPAGISSQANLIEIVPFPEGIVDITDIATASDLSSSFVKKCLL